MAKQNRCERREARRRERKALRARAEQEMAAQANAALHRKLDDAVHDAVYMNGDTFDLVGERRWLPDQQVAAGYTMGSYAHAVQNNRLPSFGNAMKQLRKALENAAAGDSRLRIAGMSAGGTMALEWTPQVAPLDDPAELERILTKMDSEVGVRMPRVGDTRQVGGFSWRVKRVFFPGVSVYLSWELVREDVGTHIRISSKDFPRSQGQVCIGGVWEVLASWFEVAQGAREPMLG